MTKTEVDKDLIRELAALMEEAGLSEIEIERDDDRMRLVRAGTAAIPAAATQPVAVAAPAVAAAPAAANSRFSTRRRRSRSATPSSFPAAPPMASTRRAASWRG